MANAPSTFLDILKDYEDFKLVVYKSGSLTTKCRIQQCAIGTSKLVITSGSFGHCLTTHESAKSRAQWTNDPDARRILSFSTTNNLNKVAISNYERIVDRAVSLLIIILNLSYLPLSYFLGMQILPYLPGTVQNHLKRATFDLNNAVDVKALTLVIQDVLKAVQLLSDNKIVHAENNFNDLFRLHSGDSQDVDGKVKEHKRKPVVVKNRKRKLGAKKIDRGRVQRVKDAAKSLGMRCSNQPAWSPEAKRQALSSAPKDREGEPACDCIKHGYLVYGGGSLLSAHLASICPTEGLGNRAPVGKDDILVRAHVLPQKFQEGLFNKDDKYVIETL